MVEHRAVEIGEDIPHIKRQIHACRQFYRAIVNRFDTALFGKGVNEQFLWAVRVHHAEADGEHEFRTFIGDLDRAQVGVTKPSFCLQVHFGDKEAHVLFEITAQDAGCTFWNPIAILGEPSFEP